MPTLPQLEKLLVADPTDAFVLYALAQEHAKLGHVAHAVDFYDRCVASDPAYCYAYFHKARLLAQSGDRPAALRALDAGLDAARRVQDAKALAELQALRDEIG